MSLDKLKLSKRLHANISELGYLSAKEIQLKSMSRIIGGQDIIGIAPEGAGKTTTYVLGVLMRLKYTNDEAPKVLVLAPNQERINEIVERFEAVSKNKSLAIMGLKTSGSMEEEIEDLVAGVDIVVATPNRARAVYLKLGLNLNRIQTFIVDDAEEIIKQGMQTPVRELAQSCGKVQYLAFSTVEHEKLHLMLDPFMPFPTIIEVDELGEKSAETHELMLYQVPNFTTKINLLNLLLRDDEVFDKVVVFVNSRLTAQKLSQSIHSKKAGEVAVLHPLFFDDAGFDEINDFKQTPECRILFIANEGTSTLDLSGIPFIFHFEVPENKETFLARMVKTNDEDETIAITFATDLELPEIKKIEQALGDRIPVMDLPDKLIVYSIAKDEKKSSKKNSLDETQGGAFHKKKESNSKTYNYGAGTKAKMTMKKKKG
ncbi:DEAD/DEAH box helicase [Sphingobacterium hungaricum]|uniref:ATP-dependent helicase n=1 Tax=Sphingobacterium hungaricum TaxID=2082723 RepID=A0A928V0G9_9SPHI|nr:DEAD/DEAH box helicase [Sphingobacterium hungaricum]MBE8714227.1 ATP-dependent helicase [Sphingobacterium hungaricum]